MHRSRIAASAKLTRKRRIGWREIPFTPFITTERIAAEMERGAGTEKTFVTDREDRSGSGRSAAIAKRPTDKKSVSELAANANCAEAENHMTAGNLAAEAAHGLEPPRTATSD